MAKGVRVQSVRKTKFDKVKLKKVLSESQYSDHTKEYIQKVLIDGTTYQAAGDEFGVSRQLVYKRCLEVLKRCGAETVLART